MEKSRWWMSHFCAVHWPRCMDNMEGSQRAPRHPPEASGSDTDLTYNALVRSNHWTLLLFWWKEPWGLFLICILTKMRKKARLFLRSRQKDIFPWKHARYISAGKHTETKQNGKNKQKILSSRMCGLLSFIPQYTWICENAQHSRCAAWSSDNLL